MPNETAKFRLYRRIQNKIKDLAFEKLSYEEGMEFNHRINNMLKMQNNVSVFEIINSKQVLESLKKL
jgi:hypothetical protein